MKTNLKENLNKLRQKKISISIGTFVILAIMVVTNIGGLGNIVANAAPSNPTVNAFIVNTVANPVPIIDTENPARQAFQTSSSFDFNDGQISGSTSFTVPLGKELVIEFVSVQGTLPSGQKIEYHITTTNGGPADYTLIPNFIGTYTIGGVPADRIDASQQLRLYADPGSTVYLNALRNSNSNGGSIFFSVSGYLVNKP